MSVHSTARFIHELYPEASAVRVYRILNNPERQGTLFYYLHSIWNEEEFAFIDSLFGFDDPDFVSKIWNCKERIRYQKLIVKVDYEIMRAIFETDPDDKYEFTRRILEQKEITLGDMKCILFASKYIIHDNQLSIDIEMALESYKIFKNHLWHAAVRINHLT